MVLLCHLLQHVFQNVIKHEYTSGFIFYTPLIPVLIKAPPPYTTNSITPALALAGRLCISLC